MCRFEDQAMKHGIIAGIALLTCALTASAQDARWSPWIGCWTPISSPGTRVCVTPSGDTAVTLSTVVEGQPALQQTLIADGADHPVSDAECRGTQRAEWSGDGQRLYANARLSCGAESRTVSGLAMIGPDGTWLDIQSVAIRNQPNTRVRRYRQSSERAAARTGNGTWLTLDAVREASGKVSPAVIEAAIVETRSRFALNSRNLSELADAHVPAALIDVMIGVSYPKKFVVERTSGAPLPLLSLDDDPYLLTWAFGYPVYGAVRGLFYPAYYNSPFAYGYSGFYYPYAFGGTSVTVPVGGGAARPTGAGRVVDGLGYTRVRPRDAEAEAAAAANAGGGATTTRGTASTRNGTASPQGYSAGSSAPASGEGSNSGSSPAAAAPSGGGEGRTAVPR
jgi:hypothetical protein